MSYEGMLVRRVGQECWANGACDFGIYPLDRRFYMDQVPLDLFQYGKRSLNAKGAGFCWIVGTDKKIAKRWATIQLWLQCKNGSQSLTHAEVIWPLKPKVKEAVRGDDASGTPDVSKPAKAPKGMVKKLDKRIKHIYDPKAYANEQQCLWGLRNHANTLERAGIEQSFLGLDNWGPHLGIPFKTLAKE